MSEPIDSTLEQRLRDYGQVLDRHIDEAPPSHLTTRRRPATVRTMIAVASAAALVMISASFVVAALNRTGVTATGLTDGADTNLGASETTVTVEVEPAPTTVPAEAQLLDEEEEGVAQEVIEIRRLVNCLRQRGIVTRTTPDETGFTVDPETAGQSSFQTHLDECKELAGIGTTPPVPLTNDEIRAIYDRRIETAECLRTRGYDPYEPPSAETFVNDWMKDRAWDPYQSIETESPEELNRLNTLCPQ